MIFTITTACKTYDKNDVNVVFAPILYSGYVRNSVLSNVRCNYIEAEDCVLINVTADYIRARPGSILYNTLYDESVPVFCDHSAKSVSPSPSAKILEGGYPARSNKGFSLGKNQVMVGIFNNAGEQAIIRSDMETDGGMPQPLTLIYLFSD